ncbi:MAG: Ig-like domain-containing protein [Patescibacteria group bacterium]
MMIFFSKLKNVHKKIIIFASFAIMLGILGVSSFVYADNFTWTSLLNVTADNSAFAGGFISEDGQRLVIAKNSSDPIYGDTGTIYSSTDGGSTWTERATGQYWTSVSATDDLTYIIATAETRHDPANDTDIDGGVFQITDSTVQKMGSNFTMSAMSSNGHVIVSAPYQSIYYSTTNGDNFGISSLSPQDFTSVTMSADGTIAYITDANGFIYKSIDGGIGWTSLEPGGEPSGSTGVATDDSGNIVYAVGNYSHIYKSTDGGTSWNYLQYSDIGHYSAVSTNSDGSVIVAKLDSNGRIYSSVDGGANFVAEISAGSSEWLSTYISKSGLRAMISSSDSYVYQGILPRVGHYYNDAIGDHDISNLNNWWIDPSCTIQANTLPGNGNDIEIYGDVSVNSSSMPLSFNHISVHATAHTDLILSAGLAATVDYYDSSSMDIDINAPRVNFHDSSSLVSGYTSGDAYFYDSSVDYDGVDGNAYFYGSSTFNGATTSGTATFYGDSAEFADLAALPYGGTIREYDSTIATSRSFVGSGAPWTVIARGFGTVVTLGDSSQYDDSTVFTPDDGGAFIFPEPSVPDAPDVPDLISSDDTGISDTDNITSHTSPTFTVAGCNGTDGDTVVLYEGDTAITGGATCSGDNNTATFPSIALEEGSHVIYAVATNGTGDSDPSGLMTVTVDIVPPEYTPVAPETGSTITSVSSEGTIGYTLDEDIASGSLTMTRTSGPSDPYSPHVCDFIGAALSSHSGVFYNLDLTGSGCSISTGPLSPVDGATYTFHFVWTDAAGNSSEDTETNITFDSRDHTVPTIEFTSPIDGSNVNGDAYPLTVDAGDDIGVAGVTYYYDDIYQIGDEVTSDPYSLNWDTTAISDGSHTLSAVVRDTSNNYATSTVNITIQNSNPPASPYTPSLATGSDSGVSESDNITNVATPTFVVLGCDSSDNETVSLYDSTNSDAFLGSVACSDSTPTITSSPLSDGNHNIYAISTNVNGDSAPSDPVTVTIDTAAPVSDFVSNFAPLFGSTLTSIGGIRYSLDENITSGSLAMTRTGGIADPNSPHVCQFVGNALNAGIQTLNLADQDNSCYEYLSSIVDGAVYDFHFEWTDFAGNVSQDTETNITFDSRDYVPPTIDFTTPTNETAINGDIYSITANVGDDRAIGGVTFYYDDTNQIDSEVTSYPYTLNWDTTAVADGSHTLTAVARDTSNNYATSTINVTIDNTPPDAPGAPELDTPSDTGISDTDNITNNTTLNILIGCADGLTASLYDGATLVTSGVCSADEISFGNVYVEGEHVVTATLSDDLGNESDFSPGLTFTIDTSAPVISSINPNVGNGSYGVGTVIDFQVDFNESVAIVDPLILTFTNSISSTCDLTLINSSTATCSYTVQPGDNSDTLNVASISGTITDVAGNDATDAGIAINSNISNAATIVIDTTSPDAPSSLSADVTDSDVALSWMNPVDSDFSSVTIRRSASGYPSSVSDGDAVVSDFTDLTYTDTSLSAGTYYYSIFAKDLTGNYSTAAHVSAVVSPPEVGDTTPPTITYASVNGSTLIITFNEPIDENNPNLYNYMVHRGDAGEFPQAADPIVDGNTVTLTLNTPVTSDEDDVSIDYLDDIDPRTQDVAGNDLEAIDGFGVENITPLPDTTAPHLTLTSSSNSTVNSIFSVTLSADEGIIGFSLTDISLTNATASNLVTLSSSSYTFDVTPLANGPLSLYIDSGTITDTSGNPNDPSNTLSRTVLFEADEPNHATSGSTGLVTNPSAITPATITHTPVVNPLPPTFFFTHTLSITNINSEVKNLQIFLNANGYTVSLTGNGSLGQEINTFGPKTKAALAKFQFEHHIVPSVGYFGPITKAYMNAMLKGGIK